ncbi:hypothetical protein AB205_0023280, partial [Aquarana catesbeiana]
MANFMFMEVQEEEEDVVEIVTTTGDRDVVAPDPFTSESAPPLEEGEIPPTQEVQEEEEDVVEIVTTTGECLRPQAQ